MCATHNINHSKMIFRGILRLIWVFSRASLRNQGARRPQDKGNNSSSTQCYLVEKGVQPRSRVGGSQPKSNQKINFIAIDRETPNCNTKKTQRTQHLYAGSSDQLRRSEGFEQWLNQDTVIDLTSHFMFNICRFFDTTFTTFGWIKFHKIFIGIPH